MMQLPFLLLKKFLHDEKTTTHSNAPALHTNTACPTVMARRTNSRGNGLRRFAV